MAVVTLLDVERFGPQRLSSAIEREVERLGGRCRVHRDLGRLRVEIDEGERSADTVADALTDWYIAFRRTWRGPA